jgi:hypothetical protein
MRFKVGDVVSIKESTYPTLSSEMVDQIEELDEIVICSVGDKEYDGVYKVRIYGLHEDQFLWSNEIVKSIGIVIKNYNLPMQGESL